MTKVYVDIDGVLLTKKQTRPVEDGANFIRFLSKSFDCYWLTTHCKGDSMTALKYLSHFYPSDIIQELHQFKPTTWDTLKTEGIDFSSDFYWLDDSPFEAEKLQLMKRNLLDRLIVVDLDEPNELGRIKTLLITRFQIADKT